ncbi:MAG: HIT family protein, partial [Pseudomonadota bacterium]
SAWPGLRGMMSMAPSRNIFDIAPADLAAVTSTTQKIARAAREAFEADGVTIQHFVESPGGQVVFHTHWHVIPRFEGVALKPHTGEIAPAEQVKASADKLRAALAL